MPSESTSPVPPICGRCGELIRPAAQGLLSTLGTKRLTGIPLSKRNLPQSGRFPKRPSDRLGVLISVTATIAPLANRAASYMGVDMLEVIGAAIFVAFIHSACSDVDAVQAPYTVHAVRLVGLYRCTRGSVSANRNIMTPYRVALSKSSRS